MNADCMKLGAFGWVELMTTDVEGAKQCYSGLFGWKTEKAPMKDVEYTMNNVDGDAAGGIMSISGACEGARRDAVTCRRAGAFM